MSSAETFFWQVKIWIMDLGGARIFPPFFFLGLRVYEGWIFSELDSTKSSIPSSMFLSSIFFKIQILKDVKKNRPGIKSYKKRGSKETFEEKRRHLFRSESIPKKSTRKWMKWTNLKTCFFFFFKRWCGS